MEIDGLSIIIPTKNRVEILTQTIKCLSDSLINISIPFEVIIVNDDKEPIESHSFPHYCKVIANEKRGAANARNYGAGTSKFSLLLFLDDDILLRKTNIQTIFEFHSNHHNVVLNLAWEYPPNLNEEINKEQFGRYLIKHGFTSYKGWNKNNPSWRDDTIFQTDNITSQNLSIKKKDFMASGKYNESFPFAGFEDHEFSKRLVNSGLKIMVDPCNLCYHNESDRLDLSRWLQRKVRGSISRQVAVEMGMVDVKIYYSNIKRALLSILLLLKPGLIWTINKFKISDGIFDKTVNILLAVSIFEGYTYSKDGKEKN